jgi:hypothetical protein
MSTEVVGLDQSIVYAQHLAEQAESHGPEGNEDYLGHLRGAGVTGHGLDTARQMQDAFAAAALAAVIHAVELDKQIGVQEQYDVNPDAGDKTYLSTIGADAGAAQQEKPMTREQAAPAAPRGAYNPDQPRATDGRWIKVGDALGYADDETCYGTDRVTGAGPVPTDLALIEYPPDPGNQSGAFVSVATPKNGYNPVSGREDNGNIYCAPQLGPDEAEAAAERLEELAGMVDSGFKPPKPTVHTRARQRMELLMRENRAASRDRIIVGDQDDFPLTAGQLLKLLSEADPTLSAPQTRHAIRAHAAAAAGGEDGTVWLDMGPDSAGGMHIVVTAVEGTEDPDDDYNRQYAAQHTPHSARELAGKLRAFAGAARRRGQN